MDNLITVWPIHKDCEYVALRDDMIWHQIVVGLLDAKAFLKLLEKFPIINVDILYGSETLMAKIP